MPAPKQHNGPSDARTAPRVVREVIDRASSPDWETWWAANSAAGHCANPVHLTATQDTGTGTGAERRVQARCKNRRRSVCPSCSALYAGDTWHLVAQGIHTPDTNGEHGDDNSRADAVLLFVTLTAPGFGPVHTAPKNPRQTAACRPGTPGACPHRRTLACTAEHAADGPELESPLCPQCYDYQGHVLFTWHLPELWDRFAVRLRKLFARTARDTGTAPVRLSFVKVVEMQRRGVPHIHAVIRLDPRDTTAPATAPDVDAATAAALVHSAARRAVLTVPDAHGQEHAIRFGDQIDVQPVPAYTDARRVAGYLAKYVTKSVAEFGLDARRLHPGAIAQLDAPEHTLNILAAIARTAATFPGHARMGDWLHTLGYRGHITTKSRAYSTTMAALRAQRTAHTRNQNGSDTTTEDAPGWELAGIGHATDGERLLSTTAANTRQEQLWAARQLAETPTEQW